MSHVFKDKLSISRHVLLAAVWQPLLQLRMETDPGFEKTYSVEVAKQMFP